MYQLDDIKASAEKVIEAAPLGQPALDAWQSVIDLGWLLVALPEQFGGLDLGVAGVTYLQNKLSEKLSPAPLVPVISALHTVSQVPKYSGLVDQVISGQVCITTTLGEYRVSAIAGNSNQYRLTGKAVVSLPAVDSSRVLVASQDKRQLFLIDIALEGVSVTPMQLWDATRQLYSLELDNVTIPDEFLIAEGEVAQRMCVAIDNINKIGITADCIGAGSAIFGQTVEYLSARQQFGRPIAMFQAIKHRCADLWADMAAAEAYLNTLQPYALTDLNNPSVVNNSLWLAQDAAVSIAEESLQLHGGIAMAVEHPCHLFVKRLLLNQQLVSAQFEQAQVSVN